jgi:GNAT superfamily N-acetyltransferase
VNLTIRRLQPSDDRRCFRSGQAQLDRFFQQFAGQNQFRHHIGVIDVAVDDGKILGFVTVSASEIEIAALPAAQRRRLPRYPLPVLRLARLGVDERAQGQGAGKRLLRFALALARQTADRIGCIGVVVDAKPEALSFYQRYGFESFGALEGTCPDSPDQIPMFLPLAAIPDQG